MSYTLHTHERFLFVHYVQNKLENGETQENTQTAIRTGTLLCLSTSRKTNSGTKTQLISTRILKCHIFQNSL